MALFAANTGLRNREVCGLQWEDECQVPELDTSVFIIPGHRHKNGEDRIVVLNKIARSVVETQRGKHATHVFVYHGRNRKEPGPILDMTTPAWYRATKKADLKMRPHDLKHTFGRRLRAAGVSLETRKVLLGHKNGEITSHYSAPEIAELVVAVESICGVNRQSPALTILRRNVG